MMLSDMRRSGWGFPPCHLGRACAAAGEPRHPNLLRERREARIRSLSYSGGSGLRIPLVTATRALARPAHDGDRQRALLAPRAPRLIS